MLVSWLIACPLTRNDDPMTLFNFPRGLKNTRGDTRDKTTGLRPPARLSASSLAPCIALPVTASVYSLPNVGFPFSAHISLWRNAWRAFSFIPPLFLSLPLFHSLSQRDDDDGLLTRCRPAATDVKASDPSDDDEAGAAGVQGWRGCIVVDSLDFRVFLRRAAASARECLRCMTSFFAVFVHLSC